MDSETDTDTLSTCGSETSRENYKSPESSDFEGYATPLASSLTDIHSAINRDITITLPDDVSADETVMESGERTPKPRILTMTQREIPDDELVVYRAQDSSEDEFYDVDDAKIRDVAQQLIDQVSETETEEMEEMEHECVVEDEGSIEHSLKSEEYESSSDSDIAGSPLVEESETQSSENIADIVAEVTDSVISRVETDEQLSKCENLVEQIDESETHTSSQSATALDIAESLNTPEIWQPNLEVNLVSPASPDEEQLEIRLEDEKAEVVESLHVDPCIGKQTEDVEGLEVTSIPETEVEISEAQVCTVMETEQSELMEAEEDISPAENSLEDHSEEKSVRVTVETDIPSINVSEELSVEVNELKYMTDRPDVLFEQMPDMFSEITVAVTPNPTPALEATNEFNQEAVHDEPMPTLVISDEVKISAVTAAEDDFFSDCSTNEVKVDFDGYSSGKEESLSSSTSSESFEFAETVSTNNTHDEKVVQAMRNSIIERYPSNETDEDELDSVSDDLDEDLLAVKQISAEVEQLVAAINAFGRDEEQQMSAYLVRKNMAAEKKRKSAMDTGVQPSPCLDQLVQTDSDFILVERHLPEVMDSLQNEIDRLQADLEKVKNGEKELLKINSKLKNELEESQQTIDGIEVEAEQQYTELTSEIDELCDIVLKKDQELASLKEKIGSLSVSETNLKDDVDSQKVIVQRQKEIIESLREELDAFTKKLGEVTKARDKAIEEATVYKMKNMERDRFLSKEAQMSMEIEDLQRELNKQKLILNQTSMAKLADTFDRKVLHLENELRERDMLICKQNQIINSHRKSPTGSVITTRRMQPRASVLAAAGNLPSAGSSSESFQNGLDVEAKEALLSFILSDRHNQLANIYNIGRILDLTPQEERAVERHLTKDRFT